MTFAEERRALTESAAFVSTGGYGLVTLTGPDSLTFLDSLASQDLHALGVGAGAHSLLLQPQGKLTADFRVLRASRDEFWLLCEPVVAPALAGGLSRFKIRVKVDIDDLSDGTSLVALRGPDSPTVIATASGTMAPGSEHAHVEWNGARVVRVEWNGVPGFDVVGPRAAVDSAAAALRSAGVAEAGVPALESVRISAGLARQGIDIDDSTIAQEAGLERDAVSFTKGCFVGQELVCRIDTRGHVNRHLRRLAVSEAEPVEAGTPIVFDSREVGVVTSAAPEGARNSVALAMLRREVEPGATVTVAGRDALVLALRD